MKTISFQQVRSAPKTSPVVYKTYVIPRAPLRHPAIESLQSAMNLIVPVSSRGKKKLMSVELRDRIASNHTSEEEFRKKSAALKGHRSM